MNKLKTEDIEKVAGGLEPRQYDDQVAPESSPSDPDVVIDYNPPVQPQ